MAINLKDYTPALMQGADLNISVSDVSIDDLTVADDATITGDLAVTGTSTLTGLVAATAGIRTVQAVTNVHDTTPTQAEMVTAFGAVPGRGFIGTIDDNDGNAISYICWSSDASYYFVIGTKGA